MAEYSDITIAFGDGQHSNVVVSILSLLRQVGAALNIDTAQIGEQCYREEYSEGCNPDTWRAIFRNKILLKGKCNLPDPHKNKDLDAVLQERLQLSIHTQRYISYPCIPFEQQSDISFVSYRLTHYHHGDAYRLDQHAHQLKLHFSPQELYDMVDALFTHASLYKYPKIELLLPDESMMEPLVKSFFYKAVERTVEKFPDIPYELINMPDYIAELMQRGFVPEGKQAMIAFPRAYAGLIQPFIEKTAQANPIFFQSYRGNGYAVYDADDKNTLQNPDQSLNLSALLHSAVMLLNDLEQHAAAERLKNAWLTAIEDGIYPSEISASTNPDARVVSLDEFVDVIGERVYAHPKKYPTISYETVVKNEKKSPYVYTTPPPVLVGVDTTLSVHKMPIEEISQALEQICEELVLKLHSISVNGNAVWPEQLFSATLNGLCTVRLVPEGEDKVIEQSDILELTGKLIAEKFSIVQIQHLYLFDRDQLGFTATL